MNHDPSTNTENKPVMTTQYYSVLLKIDRCGSYAKEKNSKQLTALAEDGVLENIINAHLQKAKEYSGVQVIIEPDYDHYSEGVQHEELDEEEYPCDCPELSMSSPIMSGLKTVHKNKN